MKIDDVDKRILVVLMQNSRLSYRKVSKIVRVSVATVMNRVKKLEKNNIIKSYNRD